MQPRDPEHSAAVIPLPNHAEARLRVALRQLDAAMAEQREALATFRREIAALGGAVAGLQDSTLEFNRRLGSVAADTARAQHAATQLRVTAEAMERLA